MENIKFILCDACCYLIKRNDYPFLVLPSLKEAENFLARMGLSDNKNVYGCQKMPMFNDYKSASDEVANE